MKTNKYGGIWDVDEPTHIGCTTTKRYEVWKSMLQRCYSPLTHARFPTYIGCSVCDEWLTASNFLQWYDATSVDGWHLDKDLLIQGNKVYSPTTCCWLPVEINCYLNDCGASRGRCLIGVTWRVGRRKYQAETKLSGTKTYLGLFNDQHEAHLAWKKAKFEHAVFLANKYRDQLDPRAFDALCTRYA